VKCGQRVNIYHKNLEKIIINRCIIDAEAKKLKNGENLTYNLKINDTTFKENKDSVIINHCMINVSSPNATKTKFYPNFLAYEEDQANLNKISKKRSSKKNEKNEDIQKECCVKECQKMVTNRSRFCLRCLGEDDFKTDYLNSGWNKVCHYHYFSDLYRYKKKTNGNTNKPLSKIQKTKRIKTIKEKEKINADMSQEVDLFQNFVDKQN
jgi:membrane-bound lytic murein transglycosylase